MARQPGGLDTLGRNSASLEGGDAALVKLRLDRGPVAPLDEVPPRSRAGCPSSGIPPRSGAGRPLERDSVSIKSWAPLERVFVSLEDIMGLPPPYLLPR
jgi:hypothetical protein